ncbi:MAG: 16S rRNA (cytidine(1402)-2'-O)-methyltransferase [Clostridia bacterium]|nr:16S rRNA (cytidine(1402)-2'-O)-methyltransferase [Clostridia bacterium]
MLQTGCLYLCATPIGNLEDITLRVLRILQEVDWVAAEDTRQTLKLFHKFDLHTPLISYHKFNAQSRGAELVAKMQEGASIALVTDAGMPGISDPGEELVALTLAAGIPIVPLPGPCAGITALVASGLKTGRFVFEGFLPPKGKERKIRLAELKQEKRTIILYESPHRIAKTLQELLEVLGNRPAVLSRELTKKFEQFYRSDLQQLAEIAQKEGFRGEITLLLAGNTNIPAAVPQTEMSALDEVLELEKSGLPPNQAIKQVAKARGLERQKLYLERSSLKKN